MLKTNNKSVQKDFRALIHMSLETEDMEMYVEQFNKSAMDGYGYDSIAELIVLSGGCHHIVCDVPNMRKQLKASLEETEEEANKYSNDKVQKLYIYLCERAILQSFTLTITIKKNSYGEWVKQYLWTN